MKIYRQPIRPTLDFYLDLGFLRLHTALWRERIEMDAIEYVLLHFEFWGREIFKVRLYETGMSLYLRREARAKASR